MQGFYIALTICVSQNNYRKNRHLSDIIYHLNWVKVIFPDGLLVDFLKALKYDFN